MSRVAIIAALPGELKPLARGWRRETRAGVDLWRRRAGEEDWIAACSGMGARAAERAMAEVEKEGPIDLFMSVGWAGALREGFLVGRAYGVSGVVDARTGERFRSCTKSEGCWLATSHRVADKAEKRRLAATYGADLVDMEAAAVARLAGMRGIPFHCIKGVSDGFEDSLPDFNPFISADGRFQRARFLLHALPRPWQWLALARLGINSGIAARQMACYFRITPLARGTERP